MKILILGGDGMLGHQLFSSLAVRHAVRVTLRRRSHDYVAYDLFNTHNSYFGIDVRCLSDLWTVVNHFQPEVIINAIGIVKQRSMPHPLMACLEINALFPQQLALICETQKIQLIHISTDCVFSGRRGGYIESDISDAEDFYGKTKYLGEVSSPSTITLRTSLIGLELFRKSSLVEWFLAQTEKVNGYQRAIFSGLTTIEMSRVIESLLLNNAVWGHVWHIASEPISKYDLLNKLKKLLARDDIEIIADDQYTCDRSLDSGAFSRATGYYAPSWDKMLAELATQINARRNYLSSLRTQVREGEAIQENINMI